MSIIQQSDLDRIDSEQPHPSANLQTEESRNLLRGIIATLPEKQQELLRLKFQGGLSYREMSEVTNLSVSNVGLILHQAVKAIRQKMIIETNHVPAS